MYFKVVVLLHFYMECWIFIRFILFMPYAIVVSQCYIMILLLYLQKCSILQIVKLFWKKYLVIVCNII